MAIKIAIGDIQFKGNDISCPLHRQLYRPDIAGYTRLMGSDEKTAVDMLSRNRTIHQSCIEKFHGILIKGIGDGILASFSLASEAVLCAEEIQKE